MKKNIIVFTLLISLSACFNMPTATSQVTGSYTSPLKYENYDCNKVSSELNSITRRESQLVAAQEQRIKSSKMQAFWTGFGAGDGLEVSELANVRGDKEALMLVMENNKCSVTQTLTQSPVNNKNIIN